MSYNNNDENNINEKNSGEFSYHWNYDDYQNGQMIPTPPPKKNKGGKKALKILAGLMSLVLVISLTSLVTLLVTGNDPLQDNLAATDTTGGQDTTDIQKLSIKSNADPDADILSTVDVIKKAKPSVVAIQVTVEQQVFGRIYEGMSVGTGFIISEDGYIVTNNHVVEGGKKITVTLGTGEEYQAQLIGGDALSDIAVVKIEAKDLPAIDIGDSDALEEGEDVVAIGTPGGIEFAGTTTKGIISAIGREIEVNVSSSESYYSNATKKMTVIQTDASINSGNSGGPLVNNKGQVVGINTMKLSSGYEGMGFAIPINGAIPIINGLIENGEVTEYGDDTFVQGTAILGISGTDITSEISQEKNIPTGIKIEQITNSALSDAGIQLGDIVIKYDGERVEGIEALKAMIAKGKVGQSVTLTVYRNGDELDFQVKLIYAR